MSLLCSGGSLDPEFSAPRPDERSWIDQAWMMLED
jgi:hypothetical protein